MSHASNGSHCKWMYMFHPARTSDVRNGARAKWRVENMPRMQPKISTMGLESCMSGTTTEEGICSQAYNHRKRKRKRWARCVTWIVQCIGRGQ